MYDPIAAATTVNNIILLSYLAPLWCFMAASATISEEHHHIQALHNKLTDIS